MRGVAAKACALSLAGMLLLPVCARASDFDSAVADLERATHVRRTYIPLMGLISACGWMYTHGSVGGLHIANLENIGDGLTQEQFRQMMESRFRVGWTRMILTRDFHTGELTLIYTRPAGDRMEMMIASLERDEVSLVNMKVDGKRLSEWVNRPGERGR